MKKILTLLFLTGCVLFASPSCTQEELNISASKEPERVPISFSFSVSGMEVGMPETKSVIEPDTIDPVTTAEQINSFVVLQFNGEDESAQLTGTLEAYPYSSEDEQRGGVAGSLIQTNGKATIVIIANTPKEQIYTYNGMTLKEFNKNFSTLKQYSDVFFEAGGKQYLRMSGSVNVESVYNGLTINVSLIRNVSKVTINVTNRTNGEVSLQNVQLRDINARYYYQTPLDENMEADYRDDYSAAEGSPLIDKTQEAFPAEGNDGTKQTFTYYVPANLRGTNESEYQYTKGKNAPPGATRFCLYGTYGTDNTPINYTYYLGENLVNDFNLKPNHTYTYDITLTSKGDARYDYRVEDLAEVKFHVDANSYMLHPPKGEGQSRIYSIPIRRAATFWNKEGENGGVYGANQWDKDNKYSEWNITPETQWTAEVLWNDFGLTNYSDFLIKSKGVGYDPTVPFDETDNTKGPYFKIKVKSGMNGNALVAVKVNDNIVWSWHLWITDYNPDQEGLSPKNGVYIYDVEGGKVHRYNSELFNTSPTETSVGYKNGFIMDRHLGSKGVNRQGQLEAMYYEFGRKDPFRYIRSTSKQENLTDQPLVMKDGYLRGSNLRYAVCNPTIYIKPRRLDNDLQKVGWTVLDDETVSSLGEGWYDPKYLSHTGDQEVLELKKSIYDPCPPGWKVPKKGFMEQRIATEGEVIKLKISEDTGYEGFYYYPEGFDERDSTRERIYFPNNGFKAADGGSAGQVAYSRLWSNVGSDVYTYQNGIPLDYSTEQGSLFWIENANTQIGADGQSIITTHGNNVRCVREYGVVNK